MKNRKPNPIILVFVILLVLILAGCLIFAFGRKEKPQDTQTNSQTQGSNNNTETQTGSEETDDTETGTEEHTETEPEPQIPEGNAQGVETFVIFGVDSRTNEFEKGTRSDSMMIVMVNHDKGTVRVASIYRDCMVHIQGKGYEKLTHAHSYGGPNLALSTINENFDLNAQHYVTVNFNTMRELVDLIGGVEIEINEKEVPVMNSDRIKSPGTYLLNGEEALTFSRIRFIDNDYKRTERQREILFEIFQKAKGMSYREKLKVVDEMLDNINTNYDQEEILLLMYSLSKYDIEAMDAFPKLFYGGRVEGAWVEVPCTLVDMNASMHGFLYGSTSYSPSQKVKEYSDIMRQKVSGPNVDMR